METTNNNRTQLQASQYRFFLSTMKRRPHYPQLRPAVAYALYVLKNYGGRDIIINRYHKDQPYTEAKPFMVVRKDGTFSLVSQQQSQPPQQVEPQQKEAA